MMIPIRKKIKNGQEIEIREAELDDVDNIWDIFNLVVDEGIYLPIRSKVTTRGERRAWFFEISTSGDFCLVATTTGGRNGKDPVRFLGQVTIESNTEWDGVEHVGTLGILVHPSYRDLGVGAALIEAACQEALNRGKLKIVLSVFSTNPRAIALYEKMGFQRVGCRIGQFLVQGTYVDEVLMEKWLVPFERTPGNPREI